jgi:Flp pilus assembly protein TadG
MHISPLWRRDATVGRHSTSRVSARSRRGQSLVEFALVVPLMVIFFVAVADMARLYTTMSTIESAAREAADYGSFDSSYWTDEPGVREQMTHRACLAASNLPDYVGTTDAMAATCTNPAITIDLIQPGAGTCADSVREPPCRVRATLAYDFHLILPIHIDFGGGRSYGFPDHLSFERTSTFAMTDLQLAP